MKIKLFAVLFLICGLALGQERGTTIPQGASIPGLGGLSLGMNGPGFIEFGGSYSHLSKTEFATPFAPWGDAYLRGVMSRGSNALNGELIRQVRYSDTGWYYNLGWIRTWNPDWYTEVSAGSSTRGFFLPKFRANALINRKILARKQLVLTGGVGYDKSKTVNDATRFQAGGTYYFERPFVLQGGVTWTHANPGGILARSQYLAVTQGHDKEHYISVRAEIGREGYELIGPQTTLFNFVVHNYSVNWRQWIGPNWGVNLAFEHERNPSFRRNGGTLGIFMDF
ncbi:MAG TPA: YaiO family outer membrane beta-barrel protein [Candidatus Solibacter sp.]|jgi:YaiO family outer membrane protein|nr:YaiO family outer membrane beta-barrel protein [Candidatus Solibacter sp.]